MPVLSSALIGIGLKAGGGWTRRGEGGSQRLESALLAGWLALCLPGPTVSKRPLSQLIIPYLNNGSSSISLPAFLLLSCL